MLYKGNWNAEQSSQTQIKWYYTNKTLWSLVEEELVGWVGPLGISNILLFLRISVIEQIIFSVIT